MRIFLLIIAIVSAIIGVILSILPFGMIALIPGIVGIMAAGGCFVLAKREQKSTKLPFAILILGIVIVITGVARNYMVKDEVVLDEEFEKKEEQRESEAIEELKELEEIEDIENLEESENAVENE